MAFVVTAFTLSQVADVEKQAAKEQDQTFLTEYRFVHSKLPSILAGNTGRTSDNASFNASFATTIASFRANLASKGYDASVVLAGNTSEVEKSECMYLASKCPPGGAKPAWASIVPLGGTEPFDADLAYDGKSDGILWMCDGVKGAIVGAVVQAFASDARSTVSETLVIALNHDWYKTEVAKGAGKCL